MANEPSKSTQQSTGYTSARDFIKSKPDLPGHVKIIQAPTTMPNNGRHYVVLCNLKHGLVCQVGDKRIKLKGSAHYLMPNKNRKFQGQLPQEAVFGATINFVDKDFWDAWVAQMMDKTLYPDGFAPITNGQLVWHQHQSEATLIRKETESIKSGFEQLVPKDYGVQRDEHAGSNTELVRITE